MNNDTQCYFVYSEKNKDWDAPDNIVNAIFNMDIGYARKRDKDNFKLLINAGDILDKWKNGESWLKTRNAPDDGKETHPTPAPEEKKQ